MQRADHDLAFMLQYENIAWYEDGKVKILDRRIYPARVEFVTCHTHQEVAQAITDMVTQSAGPYTAVLIEALVFLGGDIRCADYATPGTKEVGLNAVPALEGRRGCTLANHGVLAVGGDLAQAYLNAEYIEDVAKIYAIARSVGTPVELKGL